MRILSRVVALGVGAALAVAAANAQTRPTLRATIDETERPRPAPPTPPRQPPLTAVPTYGNPPAFGAAKTGFVSTNIPARKRLQRVRQTPQPPTPSVGQPLALTPGTEPTPAAPSSTTPAPATTTTKPTPQTPRARPKVEPATVPAPLTAYAFRPAPNATPLRRRVVEDDPFAPPGIKAGAFVLRPAIEIMTGYDSNPRRTPTGGGSGVTVITPELQAKSEWVRHELTANLRGSYTTYERAHDLDRPFFDGKLNGRIDVTRDTEINLETRLLVSTDNPGSPDLVAGLAKLPIYTTLGGTMGLTQRFNHLELSFKTMVDRTDYQSSVLTDGSVVSNKDRAYNQYAFLFRASYEVIPGVKPFFETGGDTRVHDLEIDAFGLGRDSRGANAKLGTTFELTRLLTGEIAIGYLTRTYKDPRLPDLRGLTLDGSLTWAATGLTTVKLTAKSTVEESTVPGISGVLKRDLGVEVQHAFRRWLTGTGKLGVAEDHYVGSDRRDLRYAASLALAYNLTRMTQIKGEVRREWLRSNLPGNDYAATVMMVGLRFQR